MDAITNLGTLNLVNTINLIKSITSVGTVDKVTLIDAITNLGTLNLVNTINLIKSITSIDNITSIDLIDRITLIDEITKIGQIDAIRDIQWSMNPIIVNSSFEQDFTGWLKIVNPTNITIDATDHAYGLKCCKFTGLGAIQQVLSLPLGVDWITDSYVWTKGSTVGTMLVTYHYTDASSSTDTLGYGTAWARLTLTPTAGKKIVAITFANASVGTILRIDDITTVT